VIVVCAALGFLFGSKEKSAFDNLVAGAGFGVVLLIVPAVLRFLGNSSIGLYINWGWIIVIGGLVLYVLYIAERTEEISNKLTDEDTMRRYLRHMRKQLDLPEEALSQALEDEIIKRHHKAWREVFELAIKQANSSGQEKKKLASVFEAAEKDLDEDILKMLPPSFRDRWEEHSDKEIEEMAKPFFQRILSTIQ